MVMMEIEPTYLHPAIRGKIADLQDYPVVSARVVLSGGKLAEKLCTETGMEGLFMFSRVPPGNYTLEVIYRGFSKLVQRGIAVRDHAITGLDFKMDFLEDSRKIDLKALSLEFINTALPATFDCGQASLNQQLCAVMAELAPGRVLFNPPPFMKIGCMATFEVGFFQNLKDEVMHRLLERSICLFKRYQVDVSVQAQLDIAGCQVFLLHAPPVFKDSPHYLGWKWKVLPDMPGVKRIKLRLETSVHFAGYGERKKCLQVLDRDVRIKKNHWFTLIRFLKKLASMNGTGAK
ncbi:MAG: carboxypeptidase regulatory-like domain-containing protein [Candidatus Aminicenantes bacterium]|nr:carboxypeptidase regulatory-like domain-containing protein [Candidatus Aminicenantes bacterium]